MPDPATALQASWLADLPIWLQHRDKVPHYSGARPQPRTGALDTPEDRKRLVRYRDLKLAEGFEPGYALGPVDDAVLCGVDLDKCFDSDGKIVEPLRLFCTVAKEAGALIEVSRSGTGLHVVWLAPTDEIPDTFKRAGIESYTGRRFFARGARVISEGAPTRVIMRPAYEHLPITRSVERVAKKTERGIDPPGGRNNYLREKLEAFAFAGLEGETLRNAILDENDKLVEPLDEAEIRNTIFKGIDKLHITAKSTPSEVFEIVDTPPPPPPWRLPSLRSGLIGAEPAPVEFAINGWMQQGKVGIIAAEGATGKTTLLAHLMIHTVLGRPFMGCAVKQGPCILLSRDDDQDDLDAVVQEICNTMELNEDDADLIRDNLYVVSLRKSADYMLISSDGRNNFKASPFVPHLVREVKRIKPVMIGIDTVRQFSGIESTNEAGQIVFMSVCAGLAELGPAVIVAHHVGKQAAREKIVDMYSAIGSSALADNARFMWRLLKIDPRDDDVVLPFDAALPAGSDLMQLISTRGSLRVKQPQDIFYTRTGFALEHLVGNVTKLTKDEVKERKSYAKRGEVLDHLVQCFKEIGVVGRDRARAYFKTKGWTLANDEFADLKAEAEERLMLS